MTADSDNTKKLDPRKKYQLRRFERMRLAREEAEAKGLPVPSWAILKSSGARSQIIPDPVEPVHKEMNRFQSRRERAEDLERRMLTFSKIYNAAWMVRDSQHGSAQRRRECIERFAAVLQGELQNCADPEALLFAVADSLTKFNGGLPWESGR